MAEEIGNEAGLEETKTKRKVVTGTGVQADISIERSTESHSGVKGHTVTRDVALNTHDA